jgi:hypothetical protein
VKNFFFYCCIACIVTFSMGFKNDPLKKSNTSSIVQFVYTSDAHYGLTKDSFQGNSNVSAQVVNKAMIAKINTVSTLTLPSDSGVNAGQVAGPVDYVIMTGDMANREETGIQSDSISWYQFAADYINGLSLKNSAGTNSELLLLPGNHDVSNAIGYYDTMVPLTDPTSMVQIYNRMMTPAAAKTNATYNYTNDKIHYSRDIAGIHFMYVTMWPDSGERIWMASDLAKINSTTPVLLFTHDPPDAPSKHFTNPNGKHTINSDDAFENCITEMFKSGTSTSKDSKTEQRNFVAFYKLHTNIKAYFHGHSNYTEFYTYKGPDSDIALNTIRVDSPMKGDKSESDETKLAFYLVTIDASTMKMTVRECLWDPTSTANAAIKFGSYKTISIYAGASDVEGSHLVANNFTLKQNYPNPFNPATTIAYSLAKSSQVQLKVFDMLGREIASLVDEYQTAGEHETSFSASSLPSGIYYYTLNTGSHSQTKKMALVR